MQDGSISKSYVFNGHWVGAGVMLCYNAMQSFPILLTLQETDEIKKKKLDNEVSETKAAVTEAEA